MLTKWLNSTILEPNNSEQQALINQRSTWDASRPIEMGSKPCQILVFLRRKTNGAQRRAQVGTCKEVTRMGTLRPLSYPGVNCLTLMVGSPVKLQFIKAGTSTSTANLRMNTQVVIAKEVQKIVNPKALLNRFSSLIPTNL